MPAKRTFRDGNIEYYFERRRYGGGPSTRFFCWMNYRIVPDTRWHTAPGDPWQKVTPNRREVSSTLALIRAAHGFEEGGGNG